MSKPNKVFFLMVFLGLLSFFIAKGLIAQFQVEFLSLPHLMLIAFFGLVIGAAWLSSSGHKLF